MTRLVQIKRGTLRRVALVEEPWLRLLDCGSVYGLANCAIDARIKLSDAAKQRSTAELLDYDPVYAGDSDWQLLTPMDHPDETARCVVSGTGLTHLGSARDRKAMHAATDQEVSDSMNMFRWGVEGG